MDEYLKGFNDGYKKAMEMQTNENASVHIDGKKIAEEAFPHIKLLHAKEVELKRGFY